MKNFMKNEQGLSLVEVIASILILSIVIIAFVTIFPQMKSSNENTANNLNAANIAKEFLIVFKSKSYDELRTEIKVNNFDYKITNENPLTLEGKYKYIEGEKVNVRVTVQSSTALSNITLREMLIEILNGNNIVIAEIHGYLPE